MSRNSKLFNLILLLLTPILFIHCGAPRYETGYDFLIKNIEEEKGYGLYSYLLFKEKPNDLLLEKYTVAIEVILNKTPEIQNLQYYIPKDSLNILYIPILKDSDTILTSLANTDKIEWIIDNYDYSRARAYLNKFEEDLGTGPYIISYTKALSSVNQITDKYLFQDLSFAHPRVIPLWVDEFLKQSSKAKYWDENELKNFGNDLRNTIAIAADGLAEITESLSWWKDTLRDWIVVK